MVMPIQLKPWEKAQSARREKIAAGGDSAVVRLNPIERAKLNPRSKVMAIKAMCYHCVGGEQAVQTIRGCASTGCPLHAHRPYQAGTVDDDANDKASFISEVVAPLVIVDDYGPLLFSLISVEVDESEDRPLISLECVR
jgi:hypothetical protein